MYKKIRDHVEYLFKDAPTTRRAIDLKEELIANLTERYEDLVQQGETEETAYGIVIAGIGDVEELIRNLREQQTWDPADMQLQRQRSALFVSLAVGLFIISIIFPIVFVYIASVTGSGVFGMLGAVLFFLCIALGVAMLIYNERTKPVYHKVEETVVEEFKEWTATKHNRGNLQKTIQSTIWTLTVPLFLILGIFFDAWHPGWLVFILGPVVSQIVRLIFLYKEGE